MGGGARTTVKKKNEKVTGRSDEEANSRVLILVFASLKL